MTSADEMQMLALEHADALGELLRDELAKPAVMLDEEHAVFDDGYMLSGGRSMRERLARAGESGDQREHLLAAVNVLHSVLYRVWERAKHDSAPGSHPSDDERYALLPTMLDTMTTLETYLDTEEPE